MGSLTWYEKDGFAYFSDGSVMPVVRGGDGPLEPPASGSAPLAEGTETGSAAEPPAGPARNPDGTFAPSPAAGRSDDEPDFHALAQEYESLAATEGETVALPKDKIKRWNDEHKRYRETFQPYERAFKGLHPNDQEDILRFVQALNDDTARPQAVDWMRQVLDRLSPAQQQQVANAVAAAQESQPSTPPPTPPAEEDFDPFDPAQVDARIERMMEARLTREREERQKADQAATAERQIQERARALGYDDPASTEYALLLLEARKNHANDPDPLGRAHEAIEKRLNDRAQQYLKTKRQESAQETIPPDGAAPSGRKVPRTMDEAAVAARQRLDAMLRGQPV